MPRNITAAQKRARNFHKSDALAQTNQKRCDCFFLHGTKKHKKKISQDIKLEIKILGTFLDFILLFNISVENFGKKIIWSSWSSQMRFF